MSTYALGLRCLRCDHETAGLDAAFLCPRCGANQEVVYDVARLRADWRRPAAPNEGRPDMWRYAPLLPVASLDLVSPLRIGMTPLYAAPRLAAAIGVRHLYLKDEGLMPSASLKDRASAVVAARGRETGAETLAGASTGNAGSSMACVAASTGQDAVVFVPRSAPQAKIAQLLAFGARVFGVDGTYDDAFALCQEVAAERGWLNRNTGTNPFTREGKKTCALEICEQLGWRVPDRIAVAVGDGNIISGLWKGLRDLHAVGFIDRLPELLGVQSTRSAAIARAVAALEAAGPGGARRAPPDLELPPVHATTVADSISVDAPADGLAAVRAIVESGGTAITVPDEDILAHIALVARLGGVFGEPAGVASVAGLAALARRGTIRPQERVVAVVTGNGLKDIAAVMRVAGNWPVIEPTAAAFAAVCPP